MADNVQFSDGNRSSFSSLYSVHFIDCVHHKQVLFTRNIIVFLTEHINKFYIWKTAEKLYMAKLVIQQLHLGGIIFLFFNEHKLIFRQVFLEHQIHRQTGMVTRLHYNYGQITTGRQMGTFALKGLNVIQNCLGWSRWPH